MFSSRTYSPLRSSEDSETSVKTWLPWGSWLASRRIRNAVAITLMCLLGIAFLRSSFSPFYLDKYKAYRHNTTENTMEPSDFVTLTNVHWSDFAYTQYVTNSHYLCNSVMMFEALDRLGSKADRVMMYPQEWEAPDVNSNSTSEEGKLLRDARDHYKVNLVPIVVQTSAGQEPTWQDSFTKLLAFNQTQYKRVLSLDSDGTVLQVSPNSLRGIYIHTHDVSTWMSCS